MTSSGIGTGLVATFYSYKGGVGRSMALANVAALLARWGQRVLIVDWDLEAPGIDKFFERWLTGSRRNTAGVVDLCAAVRDDRPYDWRSGLLWAKIEGLQPIGIIHAGEDSPRYIQSLRKLDWERLFAKHDLGLHLEHLRAEWQSEFDTVLIDSRTGITDIGGICTIHLPDALFAFYTANEQSLTGVANVLAQARREHGRLPVDRTQLIVVPVPSRDESDKEYELAVQWRQRAAKSFSGFFDDWLERGESVADALNLIKIPYHAYWSFGERLPVVEETDPDNPKTLAYAYQPLARLILSRFDWKEARGGHRASEEAARQEAEAARLRKEAEEVRARAVQQRAILIRQEEEELARRIDEYMLGRFPVLKEKVEMREANASRSRRSAWLAVGMSGLLIAAVPAASYFTLRLNTLRLAQDLPSAFSSVEVAGGSTIILLLGLSALALSWSWVRSSGRRADASAGALHALERELRLFELRLREYAGPDRESSFSHFATTVERILEEERHTAAHRVQAAAYRIRQLPASDDHAPQFAEGEHQTVVVGSTLSIPDSDQRLRQQESVARLHDVVISYRPDGPVRDWISQFLPLFTFWLSERLGRDARISALPAPESATAGGDAESGAGDDAQTRVRTAILSARCFMPMLTGRYMAHETLRRELLDLNEHRSEAILPVLLSGVDPFIRTLSITIWDFQDYFVTSQAFRQSELYLKFEQDVRNLADHAAAIIERVESLARQPQVA